MVFITAWHQVFTPKVCDLLEESFLCNVYPASVNALMDFVSSLVLLHRFIWLTTLVPAGTQEIPNSCSHYSYATVNMLHRTKCLLDLSPHD
jgi:hypothetical protein